jgi:hypothetical protein
MHKRCLWSCLLPCDILHVPRCSLPHKSTLLEPSEVLLICSLVITVLHISFSWTCISVSLELEPVFAIENLNCVCVRGRIHAHRFQPFGVQWCHCSSMMWILSACDKVAFRSASVTPSKAAGQLTCVQTTQRGGGGQHCSFWEDGHHCGLYYIYSQQRGKDENLRFVV